MTTPFAMGSQFDITNSSVEAFPRVAVLANGDVATVYFSNPDDVRVTLQSGSGISIDDFAVASDLVGFDFEPSIAALQDGGYVVAYTNDGAVEAQIIYGTATVETLVVSAPEGASDARVAVLADGNIVAAWAKAGEFVFRIYTPTGEAVAGPTTIGGLVAEPKPEITALADGGFVIGSVQPTNGGDPTYFVHEANGAARVNGAASIDAMPEDDTFVFALANGNFVSTFTRTFGPTVDDEPYFAIHEGLNGNTVRPATFANTTFAGDQNFAAGVGLSDGGFVIAWTDANNNNIRAQAFDSDGTTRGSEFLVPSDFGGPSLQLQVSVAEMPDGRLVFTWHDFNGFSSHTIKGRFFDPREQGITLNGTTLNDTYVGSIFADTMRGQAGNDLIEGWGGDDIIEGEADEDLLYGGAGNDIIRGGAGADYLNGGAGFDQLIGGDDNDTYAIEDKLDTIVEIADGGQDKIETTVNIDLTTLASGAFIEIVSAVGGGGVTLTGDSSSNALWGYQSSAADTLIGNGGADGYIVGVGDFVIEAAGFAGGVDLIMSYDINIDLGSAAHGDGNVENATALGAVDLIGNSGANELTGSATVDANVLTGLDGDDTYFIGIGDTVVEAAGVAAGNDTIISGEVSINLGSLAHGNGNVENATAQGAGTISLTGNGSANVLNGIESGGANALVGLGGNDTYVIGAGDTVSEAGGSGTDEVQSETISLILNSFSGIENAKLYGTNNLNVTGNGGANVLEGNLGINIITGGLGRDTMTGGAGADDFKYTLVNQTGTTAATRDKILDFAHLVDDVDLSAIDANGAAAGNTAFQFRAAKGAAFTGFKGQIRWFWENVPNPANDKTIIQGDTNGDHVADFAIELKGLINLTAADFFL